MKKRKWLLLPALITVLTLVAAPTAKAATQAAQVTFNGSALSMNVSDTGTYKTLLPGQTRTAQVTLKNTSGHTAVFYIDAAVLKGLEESERAVPAAKTAAYTYGLRVNTDGADTVLYNDLVAGMDSDGMKTWNTDVKGTAPADSDKWLYLAQLGAGQSATVSFTMGLDGASAQNEYANHTGLIRLKFRVYDYTTDQTTTTTDVPAILHVIQTGDNTPVAVLLAALAAGLTGTAACAGVWAVRRRREKGGK